MNVFQFFLADKNSLGPLDFFEYSLYITRADGLLLE